MTREEAIADIRDNIKPVVGGKSLDMAIEALEQEPCGDAISRQAAIDAINEYGSVWMEYTETMSIDDIADRALKASKQSMHKILHDLPPVTPAEKVGKWKRISMDKYSEHAKYWYRCDRCGEDNLGDTNYCPNCGQRKMQEVEE